MINNPIKKCSINKCKEKATIIASDIFYCYKHGSIIENARNINEMCQVCCSIPILPEQIALNNIICEECNKYDGKSIKRKLKELMVKQAIEDAKINIYLYDKIVDSGCSKKRPDFIIYLDNNVIVIEVDEFQHQRSSYSCECEITRMRTIYMDIGSENLLFIRFNPDKYKPSYGKEFNLQERLEILVKILKEYNIKQIHKNLEVLYLFYDGYTQLDRQIDNINPY